MKKHSKLITVLLSMILAVCLMQTAFVQAFAVENTATPDEVTKNLKPVSMEVVKAPKSVTVRNFTITDSTFWSNVVLHIVYSNGKEFDVNCDGMDYSYENGIVPPIPEIDGYSGRIYIDNDNIFDISDKNVDFSLRYRYGKKAAFVDDGVYDGDFIETKFSVKKKADPYAIAKCEVTKLPDKVFTAPLYTKKEFESIKSAEDYDKWLASLDTKNSVSNNIDGMEITYYYVNGEKGGTVTFNSNMKDGYLTDTYVDYGVYDVDKYGNYIRIEVIDKGDYKFAVNFLDYPDMNLYTYTAKSISNPNPPLPNANIKSATSDVATKDSVNSTNGTANNGVVATGDFATPAIIVAVMIFAAAVMFVFKRKRMF